MFADFRGCLHNYILKILRGKKGEVFFFEWVGIKVPPLRGHELERKRTIWAVFQLR